MGDTAGFPDENPPCRVTIERPFWISKTVITNAHYKLFDPKHDSRYLDRGGKDQSNRGHPLNRPEQPVVRVSWKQAMAFSQWLSQQTGRQYSLPTEAQWEFACRAGATAYKDTKGAAWGISDMLRMSEWTRTTYRPYPYISTDGRNDGKQKGRKVIRGAKAIGVPGARRDTFRLSYHWWQGVWNVGFRIICEDDDPAAAVVVSAE
jgi:formylglycine-generating enzyme required for sulfatase activity